MSKYFKDTGQQELFRNGYPSSDWFYDFMKRHPELRLITAQNVQSLRAMASDPKTISDWYDSVFAVMKSKKKNLNKIKN